MNDPVFYCPMHPEINQAAPGPCPKCRMDLVQEGARFGLLRHMLSMPGHMVRSPWTLAAMVIAMIAMALFMMR